MAAVAVEKPEDELSSRNTPPSTDSIQLVERQESANAASAMPPPNDSALERFTSITNRDARKRLDEPPALPFSLRDHKLSLAIFTTLVVAECCFAPLALYYGLKFGTTLRSGQFPHVVPHHI